MSLLSVFKRRKDGAASPSSVSENDALTARTHARQRLVGAAVLVAAGVIGFPLVFETQPRSVAVDIPITIPRKEGAAPLVAPAARASTRPSARSSSPPAASAASVQRKSELAVAAVPALTEIITESRAEAGREVPPPSPPLTVVPSKRVSQVDGFESPALSATKSVKPVALESSGQPAKSQVASAVKPVTSGSTNMGQGTEIAGRFVVQIGAFAEPSAARDVRKKMDKFGLKTYVQVTQTAEGERVRVRIGPFSSRPEAEQALNKAKSAGLAAVVLSI
jgi:DedD protein